MSVQTFYIISELLMAAFVIPPIVVALLGYLHDRITDFSLCVLLAFLPLTLVAIGIVSLISMAANLLKSMSLIY